MARLHRVALRLLMVGLLPHFRPIFSIAIKTQEFLKPHSDNAVTLTPTVRAEEIPTAQGLRDA